MSEAIVVPKVQIPPAPMLLKPLALGGWVFGNDSWEGAKRDLLQAAMEQALASDICHFDTAADYGNGASERLIGQFLDRRRDQVFLASKSNIDEMDADLMLARVDESLARLQTDVIDLFYIHWPRQGQDMRPLMEGLERARAQGKIRAIGVSNFSVAQMDQLSEVGRIDAHQLCYNLFWRFAEDDIIPYCRLHEIAVVTYSSIAQGVLAGKFARDPGLQEGDQRANTVHFEATVWPHIYEAVQELQVLAAEVDRPLTDLAIRWVLHQPGIISAIVGAKNSVQVEHNAAALSGAIPDQLFDRMSEISDSVIAKMPDSGNMYRYYP